MNLKLLLFVCLFNTLTVLAQKPEIFIAENQHTAPDYSQEKYWSALPFRLDNADIIPKGETWVSDSLKMVDVFYVHPTMYKKNSAKTWTADLDDKKLNKKVDQKPIKYQATPFNKTGRVYAPRYRQAHLDVFDGESKLRDEALDFAYQDVKKAFEYFLANYNQGRPIVLASHSQGTVHARRLMKEFFDKPDMKYNLVCAYLVGFGIYPSEYKHLSPCKDASKTNCYVTWSSFKEGYNYPLSKGDFLVGEVSVNPISWRIDKVPDLSVSSILLSVRGKKRYQTIARVENNMLWVKTKMPFVRSWDVMHIVDFNLFWDNIRMNVERRTNSFFR